MFPLPALPYGYDALEPVLSEVTMRTHHDKHHARYVEVVNALVAGETEAGSLEDLIGLAAMAPDRKLFNNAAQAWNHAYFWECMSPESSQPTPGLTAAIENCFGDLASLRRRFIDEGASHFGSGWVWLGAEDNRLSVFSTHDADTVVTRDLTPLLVCDVWEHAYYLDHKNDRAAYLSAWWDRLVNWTFAASQFASQGGSGQPWRYPSPERKPAPMVTDQAAYELALEEAIAFMDHPPRPGTLDVAQSRLGEDVYI
jgi:Fe-Mn family superoxide dismutase